MAILGRRAPRYESVMAERPVSMPSGITLSSQSGAIVLKREKC